MAYTAASGRGLPVRFRRPFPWAPAYTYEIVEWMPGETLVMRTAQGPFPMQTTYTWTSVDDTRTRMTMRNRGGPVGFGKILAPVMAAAIRRANDKDLSAIKRILERRQRNSGRPPRRS